MYISVVVLTCNQKALTLRCLRSLASFIEAPDCELILVDNGSTDGTADAVRAEFPLVRLLAQENNIGISRGRNAGLQRCTGEYLMILDNDTVADKETVFGLADYLHRNPEVGIVAPRLVSPDGETQRSFKSFPGIGVKIKNVLSGKKRTSVADNVPEYELEPFYIIGAAQMFTRDVYEMAGPLDEKIFYGPEDADFCMAVRKIWKRVVYCPQFTIIHDWQRATTKKLFSATGRRHLQGLLYFYAKHLRIF